MKARIPKHREFIINFPDSIDQNKANEGWAKLHCSTATIIPSSSTVLQAKDAQALFQHWYLPLWESMKKPS